MNPIVLNLLGDAPIPSTPVEKIMLNLLGDILIPSAPVEKKTPFLIGVLGTHQTCGCQIKLFPATEQWNRLHCECGLTIEIPRRIDTYEKLFQGLRWYLCTSRTHERCYESPRWAL